MVIVFRFRSGFKIVQIEYRCQGLFVAGIFFIGEGGERKAEPKMTFFYRRNWPLFVKRFWLKIIV
jgi:hypothetical protein